MNPSRPNRSQQSMPLRGAAELERKTTAIGKSEQPVWVKKRPQCRSN